MTDTTVAHLLMDAFILMMGGSGIIFRRALRGEYDPPPEPEFKIYDWQRDLYPDGPPFRVLAQPPHGPDQAAG